MSLTVEQEANLPLIIAAKEKIQEQYLGKNGVTGVGVGFKAKNGLTTDQLGIIFFVEKKQKVADKALLPSSIEGFPTDVVEATFSLINKSHAQELTTGVGPTGREDPIIGGIQVTADGGQTIGTLGIVVTDLKSSDKYILTNGHVAPKLKAKVDQPLPVTMGSNVIGDVTNTMQANYPNNTPSSSYVDAAIANHQTDARSFKEKTIYNPSGSHIKIKAASPYVPLSSFVNKSGITTGLTSGQVASINTSVVLTTGQTCYNVFTITSITDGPFSNPGDSGSVIYDTTLSVVGLLFAGDGTTTVACYIQPVLNAMSVYI